jgi:acyl-CoA thioester hydrolase
VGIFKAGEEQSVAHGYFVHVYVDRESKQPTPLPAELRNVVDGSIRMGSG